MTPVGHAAIGLVVGRAQARLLPGRALVPWQVALGSVLPDLDFALVWLPTFNELHRVITHNLSFVAIASLALGLVLARREGSAVIAIRSLALGGVLHLLADACMDANASNGIGIAILWPFADGMWSPFNLVEAASTGPGWRDPWAAIAAAATGIVWELPWIAVALVILAARRSRRG